jgi:hypothetical protein
VVLPLTPQHPSNRIKMSVYAEMQWFIKNKTNFIYHTRTDITRKIPENGTNILRGIIVNPVDCLQEMILRIK